MEAHYKDFDPNTDELIFVETIYSYGTEEAPLQIKEIVTNERPQLAPGQQNNQADGSSGYDG